jgi:hypothetical protein
MAKKASKKKAPKKTTAKNPAAKKRGAKRSAEKFDLAKLRGVPTFDLEESIILVRSECRPVAAAFKKYKKLKSLVRDAVGKTVVIAEPSYLVYQVKGHKWSNISDFRFIGNSPSPADAKALSKLLATRAIFFGNSDTSCVTQYDVYDNGKQLEYFDNFDGIKFTSRLRDVEAPEDGPDIYPFIDEFIREQDAYIPYWSALLFHGWRHKPGEKVNLDFGGSLDDKVVVGFDFVSN